MAQINGWLARADIAFEAYFGQDKGVEESERSLRRVFNNGSFKEGGRLFGGFWQELNDRERFLGIQIKQEPIVILDYAQMAPRILYSLAKAVLPQEEDLYAIPCLSGKRDGIKKVFNTLLFVDTPPRRFPAGTRKFFGKSTKVNEVLDAIIAYHKPVNHLFFTRIGFKTMFIESQVLVDVLLTFRDKGITGLPIHDGIIIAKSDREEASAIMVKSFTKLTGMEGKVTLKETWSGES
jgi:hypothetical protein